jgi:hypothetical protein
MVDRLFSEPKLAALYDALCRGRPDFGFYLPLVMGTPDNVLEVSESGQSIRLAHEVVAITGERVSFTSTLTSPSWAHAEVSRSTLRFVDADALLRFLCDARLVIDEQFGDWDRSSLTDASPEIITIARRG